MNAAIKPANGQYWTPGETMGYSVVAVNGHTSNVRLYWSGHQFMMNPANARIFGNERAARNEERRLLRRPEIRTGYAFWSFYVAKVQLTPQHATAHVLPFEVAR